MDAVVDHHHGVAADLGGFVTQLLFDIADRRCWLDAGIHEDLTQSGMRAQRFAAQHLDIGGVGGGCMGNPDILGSARINAAAAGQHQQQRA
ncbi:hypothetical protein D3C84_890090 [compost metagenome]